VYLEVNWSFWLSGEL